MKKRMVSFLLYLSLLVLLLAAGCSSSASGARGRQAAVSPANGTKTGAAAAASAANNTEADASAAAVPAESARKVVKSARLSIETLDYEKSTADFEKAVSSAGGYIENSSVEGTRLGAGSTKRTASYTARIPADRLDSFLNGAGSFGTVVEKGISGEDVTQNYYDTDSRLKSLKIEQTRLLTLMEKAGKIEDVIAVEKRLTEVQAQIEQLTGELKRLDALVSLATVTADISEVEALTQPAAENFGGQIGSVFHASIRTFVHAARTLFLALVAALPFAAVAAAVIWIVLRIRRRRKSQKP